MKTVTPDHARATLREFIRDAGNEWESSRIKRITAARRGRAAGLTYQEIGDQLGITHAAVIGLLKRNADAA